MLGTKQVLNKGQVSASHYYSYYALRTSVQPGLSLFREWSGSAQRGIHTPGFLCGSPAPQVPWSHCPQACPTALVGLKGRAQAAGASLGCAIRELEVLGSFWPALLPGAGRPGQD